MLQYGAVSVATRRGGLLAAKRGTVSGVRAISTFSSPLQRRSTGKVRVYGEEEGDYLTRCSGGSNDRVRKQVSRRYYNSGCRHGPFDSQQNRYPCRRKLSSATRNVRGFSALAATVRSGGFRSDDGGDDDVVVFDRETWNRRRFSSSAASTTEDEGEDSDAIAAEAVESKTKKKKKGDASKGTELEMNLRPTEVVQELDRYIVGQGDAKRAVAIAMRNRWRRKQLSDELRKEVTPRNVLLVGPTGCGKTEVARRMAQLNDAPFIKVEATKFTEVGYHGRDVDQIIRDLMDISMQLTKKLWTEKLREQAKESVEDKILDLLTGPAPATVTATKKPRPATSAKVATERSSPGESAAAADHDDDESGSGGGGTSRNRESFRDLLRQGLLDDQEIDVDVPVGDRGAADILGGDASNPNIVAMSDLFQRMSSGQPGGGGKKQPTERKRLPISEARDVILEIELDKLLENVDLKKEAVAAVEESGIVFIDEIDKICSSRDSFSSRTADASAEGVQRDLLPLIEGTTISTKYGNVNTDYILFVASGAFHAVKPSDLLPELQGRLPIRVELKGLTEDDLYRILTEPVANLVRQQVEMIATEGVTLEFDDDAVREIARMAAMLNKTVENIGARRLHTVMERIMEELSFQAAEKDSGTALRVDKALVEARLSEVTKKTDLSKYIL